MLDIKFIKNNAELVKQAMKNRQKPMDDVIDEIISLDEKRLKLISEVEAMRAEQNAFNKKIPAMKKSGEDTTEIMAKMKEISNAAAEKSKQLTEIEKKQRELVLGVPNVPNESVPYGKDDSENPEVRRHG